MSQPKRGLKAGERHLGKDESINLFRCAQKGNVGQIHKHLCGLSAEKRRREIRQPDSRGICILFYAIKYMRSKVLKHFFSCTTCMMDINTKDKEGQGVFHYAAKMVKRLEDKDKVEKVVAQVMKILFKMKGDPELEDNLERIPMHIAAGKNTVLVAKHLVVMGTEGKDEEDKKEYIKCMILDAVDVNERTPLHEAVAHNNREMVDFLFDTAKSVEITANDLVSAEDYNELTPLHHAALERNVEMAKRLVEAIDDVESRKETIDKEDENGDTALCYAIENSCCELVDYLIKEGASTTEICGPMEQTVLLKACMAGEMNVVKKVFNSNAKNELYETDEDFSTPLHKAIEYMNFEAVQFLLKHKDFKPDESETDDNSEIDDEKKDKDVKDGYKEAVNIEIENIPESGKNDADSEEVDDDDDEEEEESDDEEYNMLEMADYENFTPLLSACCYDDDRVVKLLLKENADIKKRDHLERSPLLIACMYSQVKSVQHLLHHIHKSTDPKVKDILKIPDHNGNTPLHICAESDSIDCAKELLKHQAPIGVKNDLGETPFLTAIANGSYEMCKIMLEVTNSECIHDTDEKFRNGLHIACQQGHLNVAKLLVTHKVDKQSRDETGRRPMDYAAEFGHLDLAIFLLNNNARIDEDIEEHLTPLQHASLKGHASIVKLFLDKGPESADVSTLYKNGLNALDMAIDKGHVEAAQAIVESSYWRVALMNADDDDDYAGLLTDHEPHTTPLRKLIIDMPDVAKIVLDNCVKVTHEKDIEPKKKPDDTDSEAEKVDSATKKRENNCQF